MGFVEVIPEKEYDKVDAVWDVSEYLDCREPEEKSEFWELSEELWDGRRIAIGPDYALVLFCGDKVVDYVVGPGGFLYHTTFEPGQYTEKTKKWIEWVAQTCPQMLASSVDANEKLCLYMMRLGEKKREAFSFQNATYHEGKYGIDIKLQGAGNFCCGIADPLLYYMEAGGTLTKLEERFASGQLIQNEDELVRQLQETFPRALQKVSDMEFEFSQLPYETETLIVNLNLLLETGWKAKHGIEVKQLSFFEIYPDEESVKKLIQAKKNMPETKKNAEPQSAAPQQPDAGSQKTSVQMTQDETKLKIENVIRQNYSKDHIVAAVKHYRDITGAGLAEAKNAVERILS